jgi:hypothetical protein
MSPVSAIPPEWPEPLKRLTIIFPKSQCGLLQSYVLACVSEPKPHLLLAAPFREEEATAAVSGETLLMQWHSERGLHVLAGKVGSFVGGEVIGWRVDVDDVEVTNRRRHVRVPADGHLEIMAGGKCRTIELIDISESGVRCRWRDDDASSSNGGSLEKVACIYEASTVGVTIHISTDVCLNLAGSVARVQEADQGVEFSVVFVGLDENDKSAESLRKYICALQREQMRRMRSQ